MNGSPLRYAWAVLRELLLGVGTWVAVVTGLFVLFHAGPTDPARRLVPPDASAETVAAVRARMGLDEPLPVQWVDWLWSYTTLGYGQSFLTGQPVRDVVLPAVGRSLLLGVVTAVVVAVFGVVVVGLVAVAADTRARPVVVAATSLPGTVSAVIVAICSLVVLTALGTVPTWSRSGLGNQLLVLLTMATALAVPPVGWTARRAGQALAARQPDRRSVRAALGDAGGAAVRRWSLHLWLVGSYVAGALVAVEPLFAYPGVGRYLTDAVANRDVPLVLGLAAALLLLSVAAGVVRNLSWAVGGVMSTAESTDGDADGAAGGRPTADGGTRTGERSGPEPTSGEPRPEDAGSTEPTVGAALATVVGRGRVLAGVVWLAFLAFLGIGGSLLLSPESPAVGGTAVALGPGQLLNTTGALVVVAVGAFVLGGVPGAVLGALAGALESAVGGIVGRAGGTLLRAPTDLLLVGPLVVVVLVWITLVGTATGRAGTELLLVVFGGLAVGAYAFRTAQTAVTVTPDDWDLGNRFVAAAPAGLDGASDAAVVVALAACELAVLGMVPRAALPALVELQVAIQRNLGFGDPLAIVVALLQAALPVAAVAIGVFLLGDGLGAGARAVRREP